MVSSLPAMDVVSGWQPSGWLLHSSCCRKTLAGRTFRFCMFDRSDGGTSFTLARNMVALFGHSQAKYTGLLSADRCESFMTCSLIFITKSGYVSVAFEALTAKLCLQLRTQPGQFSRFSESDSEACILHDRNREKFATVVPCSHPTMTSNWWIAFIVCLSLAAKTSQARYR